MGTETLIDYNDKEAMIKPLNLESKSQIKDNTIHNDIEDTIMESILNKLEGSMQKSNIETTSSLLPKNIDFKLSQNLSSIMPQKSNLILKKRKSIEDVTHLNNNLSPALSDSISLQEFPETI